MLWVVRTNENHSSFNKRNDDYVRTRIEKETYKLKIVDEEEEEQQQQQAQQQKKGVKNRKGRRKYIIKVTESVVIGYIR